MQITEQRMDFVEGSSREIDADAERTPCGKETSNAALPWTPERYFGHNPPPVDLSP